MKNVSLFFFILLLIFLGACRKDFDTIPSVGNLEFSKDTVLLNRVFDNISSSTQSFKVYNKSDDDIHIPRIALGRGDASMYRLNVDGVSGKSFENIQLLANDSIYVFVEATIDFNQVTDTDFFYRDSVVFYSEIREQDVKLEALVLDVNLIRPDRQEQPDGSYIYEEIILAFDDDGKPIPVKGTLLSGDTTFTNEKPYLIYGYVGVPSGATLNIEAGTTLYFHDNSGVIVQKGGSLKVNGTLEEEVLFEDDRLEPDFEEVPGQWGTIWLRAGSKNNSINHAIIKNNIIGVIVDSTVTNEPTLLLDNTKIYNTSNYGLLGREARITASNLVIGNNGLSSLACTMGGHYNFTHCTIGNFWNASFRQLPALLVNNFLSYLNENDELIIVPKDLEAANFTNCIVVGDQNIEFALDKIEEAAFNFKFKNCLLRFDTNNNSLLNDPLYNFEDTNLYENLVLNGFPHFKDVETNDYIIGQDSEAINQADQNGAMEVPLDILGVDRVTDPDIGAYQHTIFEAEE